MYKDSVHDGVLRDYDFIGYNPSMIDNREFNANGQGAQMISRLSTSNDYTVFRSSISHRSGEPEVGALQTTMSSGAGDMDRSPPNQAEEFFSSEGFWFSSADRQGSLGAADTAPSPPMGGFMSDKHEFHYSARNSSKSRQVVYRTGVEDEGSRSPLPVPPPLHVVIPSRRQQLREQVTDGICDEGHEDHLQTSSSYKCNPAVPVTDLPPPADDRQTIDLFRDSTPNVQSLMIRSLPFPDHSHDSKSNKLLSNVHSLEESKSTTSEKGKAFSNYLNSLDWCHGRKEMSPLTGGNALLSFSLPQASSKALTAYSQRGVLMFPHTALSRKSDHDFAQAVRQEAVLFHEELNQTTRHNDVKHTDPRSTSMLDCSEFVLLPTQEDIFTSLNEKLNLSHRKEKTGTTSPSNRCYIHDKCIPENVECPIWMWSVRSSANVLISPEGRTCMPDASDAIDHVLVKYGSVCAEPPDKHTQQSSRLTRCRHLFMSIPMFAIGSVGWQDGNISFKVAVKLADELNYSMKDENVLLPHVNGIEPRRESRINRCMNGNHARVGIGIAEDGFHRATLFGAKLFWSDGSLSHDHRGTQRRIHKSYAHPWHIPCEVTVHVRTQRHNKQVIFAIDGLHLGVAFTLDADVGFLAPLVVFTEEGLQASIISS